MIPIDIDALIRPLDPLPNVPGAEKGIEAIPDWKQTYTGRAIIMSKPSADCVDLIDIAMSTAGQARYDGHTRSLLSIAGHEVFCMMLVMWGRGRDGYDFPGHESLEYDVVTHDSHEFVTGDLTTPTKNSIELVAPGAKNGIKRIQREWDMALNDHLRLPFSPPRHDLREATVKRIDETALFLERNNLLTPPPAPWFNEEKYETVGQAFPGAGVALEVLTGLTREAMACTWLAALDLAVRKARVRRGAIPDWRYDPAMTLIAQARIKAREIKAQADAGRLTADAILHRVERFNLPNIFAP